MPHPPDQAGVSQTPWLGWRVLPATHGHSQEALRLPFYPETVTDHFHRCSSHPTVQGQGKSASKEVQSPSKHLPYVRGPPTGQSFLPVPSDTFASNKLLPFCLRAPLPTNPLPCFLASKPSQGEESKGGRKEGGRE